MAWRRQHRRRSESPFSSIKFSYLLYPFHSDYPCYSCYSCYLCYSLYPCYSDSINCIRSADSADCAGIKKRTSEAYGPEIVRTARNVRYASPSTSSNRLDWKCPLAQRLISRLPPSLRTILRITLPSQPSWRQVSRCRCDFVEGRAGGCCGRYRPILFSTLVSLESIGVLRC